MATRIIGKVAFRPRGNWNGNVTDYERLDTVVDSNVMYIALQDVPVGTPVSNTTYWQRCIDGFGGSAQLDTEMSDESVNGVQNKVIKAYVDTQVSDKVDKEDGKGLSTNDYTNEDKALVDTIEGKVDLTSEGANALITSMESSTNAINDNQLLIASSGTGYFKRKFSLVWDYIKSKLATDIPAQSIDCSTDGSKEVYKGGVCKDSYGNLYAPNATDSSVYRIGAGTPSSHTNNIGFYYNTGNITTNGTITAKGDVSGTNITTMQTKLNGIAEGANKTTVDTALSSSSTNPVQNKVVNTALGNKVDKVSGKGLSTNDFTATYKTKLDAIGSYEEIELKSDVATTHQTAKSVVSKELPAGTYIITGQIRWNSNATGVRIGGISTSADSVARDFMLGACPNSYTVHTITKLINLTKKSTIYLNAYHNAGSGVSINVLASGTFLRVFRIA